MSDTPTIASPVATGLAGAEPFHIGRGWPGLPPSMEDECPCPQEPCGLISATRIDPDCPQHAWRAGKTMRQGHSASNCPGERPDA